MKILGLVSGILCLVALACHSNQQMIHQKEGPAVMKKPHISAQDVLAPGTCRVVAVVKEIKSDYRGKGPDDPCSRVPCHAVIEIETVEGCGSGMSQVLPLHQPVLAHFLPTLNPRIAFPDQHYQGTKPLYVGRRFRAIVEVPAEHLSKNTPLLVKRYDIISQSN